MPARRTASRTDYEPRLAEAALKLLGKQGWKALTLASLARSAGRPLPDVLSILPSKSALPGIILRKLAKETARRYKTDGKADDPRERLFDVTMTWFDVQQSHAKAMKGLYRALQYDPATLLTMRSDVLRLAGELLALAEADFGPVPGVQAAVFAGILVRAASSWRDDDEEMGGTMAQLERDLRRAQRLLWSTPARSQPQKVK